mmetsp:Transcript_37844/g.118588  ORF Transcript_37844/g.118588 Transcript_37844/m.118588 type:complete len:528 (-) Transcript_37844:65-1648(-)
MMSTKWSKKPEEAKAQDMGERANALLVVDDGHFHAEDSPSYDVLRENGLIDSSYRVRDESAFNATPANSTPLKNLLTGIFCCPALCCGCVKAFEVPEGSLRLAEDGKGNFEFFGAGVHQVWNYFYRLGGTQSYSESETILHGNRTIVTVPQGHIGYCVDKGQPVLLPPGMHQWTSNTLRFLRNIDLENHVIDLGPWTLLTIDEGYMAVTQDNGKQIILPGGNVHLLTHRNHKFEKMVSTKIQTNNLQRNEAASADNVIMLVDATVLWRISDVMTAVRMSADTMNADGTKIRTGDDINKLRNDVLKQAEASLAMFIGTINFSDTFAAAASLQRMATTPSESQPQPNGTMATAVPAAAAGQQTDVPTAEVFNLYNNEQLRDAVSHANEVTSTYGVEIISINIISAVPKDRSLQESLAAGAVAAAEARMMETTAEGRARALAIESAAQADQKLVLAKAEGDSEVLRAQGAREAAQLLEQSEVAVQLAAIEKTGAALAGQGNNSTFFFGASPDAMSSLLSNENLVGANQRR